MNLLPCTLTSADLVFRSGVLVAEIKLATYAGELAVPEYTLDEYHPTTGQRAGSAYGCQSIRQLMVVAQVQSWAALAGAALFCELDSDRLHVTALVSFDKATRWAPREIGDTL